MLAELPLPWTLESLWTLVQLAVQISFVALIVVAIVMVVLATFVNATNS